MTPATVCHRCGAAYEGSACLLCGDTLLLQGDPLVGRVIAGRYRVIRKLGQGGMGAVYLAEQVGLGHKVALKFLNAQLHGRADLAQRFLNEARSYARLAHPHAITFHEFGQDESGNLYISMEYVEGPDLKTLLDRQGRLAPAEAVEIVLQVADALEHAHGSGVIHRDLKPDNVIVRQGLRGPHAKVLDFGIAKLLGEGGSLTVEGSIAGTPQYMPPEQIRGEPVDARADVYVLGVVLYELLTGANPFVAASIPEMLRRQAQEPLPRIETLLPDFRVPALDEAIRRATEKDREARFPSMAAFASALEVVTQTSAWGAAVARIGGAGAAAPRPDPGGTWVRGPGAQVQFPSEPVRSGTALGVAPLPSVALELPQTEVPPPRRQQRRGGGLLLGAAALVLGGAGGAFAMGLLPLPFATSAPAVAAEPSPAPAPAPAAVAAAPAPTQAAAAPEGPAPAQRLREELLAREIWLKGNAEFLAGNLGSAREILATVPDDPGVAAKVAMLRQRIDAVEAQLESARSLAARGDCLGAIAAYDRILRDHPHFREAAAGRARCQRMLPPSLAE
ncbi:serine/threonine-protein kinase [Vulgatibacter sp.]|uniref:serine/threonine-protein kinase n=1 Tax=Vulgatibacter sp. TaxID=1971226 RepID=UPI0035661929